MKHRALLSKQVDDAACVFFTQLCVEKSAIIPPRTCCLAFLMRKAVLPDPRFHDHPHPPENALSLLRQQRPQQIMRRIQGDNV
jgi:hypothetical protein